MKLAEVHELIATHFTAKRVKLRVEVIVGIAKRRGEGSHGSGDAWSRSRGSVTRPEGRDPQGNSGTDAMAMVNEPKYMEKEEEKSLAR